MVKYRIDAVDKLIIVDHLLKVKKFKEGWAEEFIRISENGFSNCSTIRGSVLNVIEETSNDVNLYPQFREFKLVEFMDSDHLIRLCKPEKYLRKIESFILDC